MPNKVTKLKLSYLLLILGFLLFFQIISPSPTHASSCSLYNSSQPVQEGFGASYNVLSPQKETLIKTDCQGDSVDIEIGNNSANEYIYKKGYVYRDGWEEIEFKGNGLVANNWYVAKANLHLDLEAGQISENNYIVAYICTWTGNGWKCGCRDNNCIDNFWQLQKFKKTETCIDEDHDGYGIEGANYCQFPDIDCNDDPENNGERMNPGKQEVCNDLGLDENCNGEIDEGCACANGNTKQCGTDTGLCQFGTQTCLNGQWGNCTGNIDPQEEICENGIDEDCNGSDAECDKIAHGYSCTSNDNNQCDQGLFCKTSFRYGDLNAVYSEHYCCAENECAAVIPTQGPSPTGIYNCVGEGGTDEKDSSTGKIYSVCHNGEWQEQNICEDIDRDGYDTCSPGETGDDGKEIDCDDNEKYAHPNGGETCDTVDNNCNGTIDEGCDEDQDGYCNNKMKIYRSNAMCPNTNVEDYNSGTYGDDCNDDPANNGERINPGQEEVCDDLGLDENCNGEIDEGCACVNNDTKSCGSSDVGACQFGTQTCLNGQWGHCTGNIDPQEEICGNDIDENCDGSDAECCEDKDHDGYGIEGANYCQFPDIDCDDNEEHAHPGGTETCDTIDNDCNGETDEGCDDDQDGYCDKDMSMYNSNSMCPHTTFNFDGQKGNDPNDEDPNIIPDTNCTDTDGGDNQFQKGQTRVNDEVKEDNCLQSGVLEEWYCDANKQKVSKQYTCHCYDGVCLSSPVTASVNAELMEDDAVKINWNVEIANEIDIEIWRASDNNGSPNDDWTEISSSSPSFNPSALYSGDFIDRPVKGTYWYGIHIINPNGEVFYESNPPGPVKIVVPGAETCIAHQERSDTLAAICCDSGDELKESYHFESADFVCCASDECVIDLVCVDNGWYSQNDNIKCENGNWIEACTDGDNGKDYSHKATIDWTVQNFHAEDYCDSNSDNTLVEYYCDQGMYKTVNYTCPNGCLDGACLSSSCIDKDNDAYDNCDIGQDGDDGKEIDCDDNNANINPEAEEICGNDIDENCDGSDAGCEDMNVTILDPDNNAEFSENISEIQFHGKVSGGEFPYTYKWSSDVDGSLGEGEWLHYLNNDSHGQSGLTMAENIMTLFMKGANATAGLSIGHHIITLTVEDKNGEVATDEISINIIPSDTMVININNEGGSMNFVNNVYLFVNVSGGAYPYSLEWSTPGKGVFSTTTNYLYIDLKKENWDVGEYLIKVEATDSNKQVVSKSFLINILAMKINSYHPDSAYFKESVNFGVSVEGGELPYIIKWSSDKDGELHSVNLNRSYFSFNTDSLSEGMHSITATVTDNNGNQLTKTTQIQINPIDFSKVECSDFLDCNDNDPCTNDVCNNPGLMSSNCSYPKKTICQNDDNCCPDGCNSDNDNECTISPNNDDPAKVLVVYNNRCANDKNDNGIKDYYELAQYYKQKRNIPDENMLPIEVSTGSGGCSTGYGGTNGYKNFHNELVEKIQNKLSLIGKNNIYYLLLIGIPTTVNTEAVGRTTRSLDQALITLNSISDPKSYPSYWDYCNTNEYCERYYGSTLKKPRFNHSYKYNGDDMYLVARIHDLNLVDRALYGEKYIYNEDGYYRGMAYVDTRYGAFSDSYLNDNYPVFSDAKSYAKGDRKMAYGKRIFEIEGWDYKWESTGKEIGESGAVFGDGSSAESVSDAMWYEGWYNYGRYLDVWQWKAGAVACDLNSNSGTMRSNSFLGGAFANGLTAGVGVTGEPYLTGHPQPEVFIHYMLNGYNFAESAALSYPGFKWRDIAHGDPLYNPNKKDKEKVKDTVAPNIMQVFSESNIDNTASSVSIMARLNMNSDIPDLATMKLDYGIDTNYGTTIKYDEIYSMEKKFILSNLLENTKYYYKITAKDPVGNTSVVEKTFKTSASKSIPSGMISASASVQIGNAPLNVNFSSNFSETPSSVEWNFADDNTDSNNNPSHVFNKGFYRVVLHAEFLNGLSLNKELLIIAQ